MVNQFIQQICKPTLHQTLCYPCSHNEEETVLAFMKLTVKLLIWWNSDMLRNEWLDDVILPIECGIFTETHFNPEKWPSNFRFQPGYFSVERPSGYISNYTWKDTPPTQLAYQSPDHQERSPETTTFLPHGQDIPCITQVSAANR